MRTVVTDRSLKEADDLANRLLRPDVLGFLGSRQCRDVEIDVDLVARRNCTAGDMSERALERGIQVQKRSSGIDI